MFSPSNNNENPNFLHHSETLLKPPFPFPFHQNPSSSTLEDHPPFLYFPSPFLDHADMPLSQIFAHHQHQQQQPLKSQQKLHEATSGEEPDITPKSSSLVTTPKKKRSLSSKPRKRTGKTDRHSKIKTAQGVRDRRMRLSVQIARKFFDLQDMLGFDKASKTIEWLFSNSKNAIKELSTKHNNNANNNNNSSTSSIIIECGEDNSKIDGNDDEVMKEKTRESIKEKLGFSSNPNNNNNNNNKNLEELGLSSNPSPFLDQEPNSYIGNSFIRETSSPHEANNSIASIFECYHNLYSGISTDTDSIMGGFLENWEFDSDPRIIISPFSGNLDSNI